MKNFLQQQFLNKVASAIFGISVILISTSTVNAQQGNEVPSEVKSEVERLNHEMETSIQKKDIASIIDMYADDATIIVPGGKKIQGRKAIAAYWYSLTGTTKLNAEILELGGNGKIVYEIGKWTITSQKDGSEHTTSMDVVLVWKRQVDYSYKIQLNSTNNPVALVSSLSPVYEAVK